MKTELFSNLLDFLKNEKIEIKKSKVSDSEFWLDNPEELVTVKFVINNKTHEILYDIYSAKYIKHFKEETIRDVERLEDIAEAYGNWNLANAVEDIWLILDGIKYWAHKNRFIVKETELI